MMTSGELISTSEHEIRQSLAETVDAISTIKAIAEDEDHEDCHEARRTLARLEKRARDHRRSLRR